MIYSCALLFYTYYTANTTTKLKRIDRIHGKHPSTIRESVIVSEKYLVPNDKVAESHGSAHLFGITFLLFVHNRYMVCLCMHHAMSIAFYP